MKRYNKVKAGCDDRKPGGRPAAMDKDKAAEYIRILMTEAHCANEKIGLDKVAEIVSQEFKVVVSSTWVSRIMKKYEINHKPLNVERRRASKPHKAPSVLPIYPEYPDWQPLFALPNSGQCPSFRGDLQQAMATSNPPSQGADLQQSTSTPDHPTHIAPSYTYGIPATSPSVQYDQSEESVAGS